MRYESKKTEKGNVGVSWVSAAKAAEQAEEMDANDCTDCTGCTYCTDCTDCTDCTGCKYFISGALATSPEQQVANLDKVGAIILDDASRLRMNWWHGDDSWADKTCAEEAVCGTSHCLAGWLQVCSTNPKIRAMEPEIGGAMQAPIAAKLFYRGADEVIAWLKNREYVKELGVVEPAPAQ